MPDTLVAPAFHWVPPHVGTFGPEVSDWADSCGLTLDPEQRLVLDAMYAHGDRGELVATEAGLVCGRQNIKTHVYRAAALADLFLFDEPGCLWTAHQRITSMKSFELCKATIDNYDHLRRYVRRMPDTDGEEAIELLSGASLEFRTRTTRGGRGLSGRRLTLDEALYLTPGMLSALVPVLSAQTMTADVQLRYGSSAGLAESAVLRGVRDRGRAGGDRRLTYTEWTADQRPCAQQRCRHERGTEGCALDDVELLRQANPALERRISVDFVLGTERAAMTPAEFARERLGWWDEPAVSGEGDLDAARFVDLGDPSAEPARPLVLGVDQGEDRLVSIGVAWRRPDRSVQVMLSQAERVDVGLSPLEAVVRLAELRRTWGARVILGGPALGLEQDLKAAGVPCEAMSGSQFAVASGHVDDRIRAGTLRHGNQPELIDAVRVARFRSAGAEGQRAFQLKNVPGVGPLAAVTRAVGGLLNVMPSPPPKRAAQTRAGGQTSDLNSMQF